MALNVVSFVLNIIAMEVLKVMDLPIWHKYLLLVLTISIGSSEKLLPRETKLKLKANLNRSRHLCMRNYNGIPKIII